ncbi:TPA: hypothetical protein ACH9CF_001035 [Streptococcus pneumoniae]|jgi:hypothetical protein|uniref:Uncharacterized protein n=1 Tax=Streptococcus oralis (strain Uo5) TaxID=927666 RepID=F2QGF6_STROU|nr:MULTISPECIES: hypothetical protein [Streptococcus]MBS9397754.1 hypothetical protein [Streptococcus oralis]MBW8111302.1 hypothetical protein [Streptococcus pneumoniae]CBY99817.1 conserved hypothetical protein [Streptococcus oralis Uo5]CVO41029.1 Uncharacterised protein [Streptococcus pneumoniae]CVR86434.1 Uncharacterised protein [Streptococcus pneumoniae]
MNEISVVVKLSNGSLMGATECDENPYKALLKILQVVHMQIVDELE